MDQYVGQPSLPQKATGQKGADGGRGSAAKGAPGGNVTGRGFGKGMSAAANAGGGKSKGKGAGRGVGPVGMYPNPAAQMNLYAQGFGYPGYPGIAGTPMAFPPFPRKGTKDAKRAGSSTVKVQPVPAGTTKETLASTFSSFGEVASAVVKRGSPTYGYVNFTTAQAAQAAVDRGQVEIAGTWVQVTLGKKRKTLAVEAGPSNGIGLFNLPFSTTHDELHYMLEKYAGFQSVKMVQRKDTGQFKGYAFAYFATVENAVAAKAMLAGLTIGDQYVDVKFASQPNDATEA